ncbi:hypothetical protein [Bartonella sp. AU55XJBT]|uniref:hypothetical protein n=1 Tax=Bartonella sp. AU55XJBT TaxID=3019091 RepID=UPI0023600C69|nr:hypothetical protein [Bartonella sp. AU55XJBT]
MGAFGLVLAYFCLWFGMYLFFKTIAINGKSMLYKGSMVAFIVAALVVLPIIYIFEYIDDVPITSSHVAIIMFFLSFCMEFIPNIVNNIKCFSLAIIASCPIFFIAAGFIVMGDDLLLDFFDLQLSSYIYLLFIIPLMIAGARYVLIAKALKEKSMSVLDLSICIGCGFAIGIFFVSSLLLSDLREIYQQIGFANREAVKKMFDYAVFGFAILTGQVFLTFLMVLFVTTKKYYWLVLDVLAELFFSLFVSYSVAFVHTDDKYRMVIRWICLMYVVYVYARYIKSKNVKLSVINPFKRKTE